MYIDFRFIGYFKNLIVYIFDIYVYEVFYLKTFYIFFSGVL